MTPFAALWMRATNAINVVAARLASFGARKTLDGNWACLCGAEFSGVSATEQCARCWLRHGLVTLDKAVQEAVPQSCDIAIGGRWIQPGEECESCGSKAGGWVCGGSSAYIASCEEACLFHGLWQSLTVAPSGELAVDCRRHCVHMDGKYKVQDGGLAAIVKHLAGHKAASKHYTKRLNMWARRARTTRSPAIPGQLLAKHGPIPAEFQSRIRAFTRASHRMPADELLEQFVKGSVGNAAELRGTAESKVAFRRGSVVLPDLESDGFVILKMDTCRKRVQTAVVRRDESCARHPKCVCYSIYQYEKMWRSMADVSKGQVVCLTPRFGWKHDFSLPLEKVCWRRATPDAVVNAAPKSGDRPTPDPEEKNILRCARLLERCREDMALQCEDYVTLRYLGFIFWPICLF